MDRLTGLSTNQVKELREIHGLNVIVANKKGKLKGKLRHIIAEPIYVLLVCAAVIYFFLGEMTDGVIMIFFVLFVIGIDFLQEVRTGNALKRLRELSEPKVKVVRDGRETYILSEELVPGDILLVSEGIRIPADGRLLYSNGLCVDESILTGEAEGVWKQKGKDYCYAGTMVVLGNGTIQVEQTGTATKYGQIADQLEQIRPEASPLQKQMKQLAGQFTNLAAILFFMVGLATYYNMKGVPFGQRLIESFLAGVVLALSMIPGEFPVIQSVYLSMGALRLARKKALVRRLSAVETLGDVSVLCIDKTGTVTKNQMEVKEFSHLEHEGNGLCRAVALACKEDTYDPMEIAMLKYCGIRCVKGKLESDCLKACILTTDRIRFLREYPFTNELKAMGQVWSLGKDTIIAVKGSIETVVPLCVLSEEQERSVMKKCEELSGDGLRVIAVAEQVLPGTEPIPEQLMDCRLILKGLIGLYDPPRDNIIPQIKACYRAGIRIIMITGDYPKTASTIARQVGIKNCEEFLTGEDISKLKESELREAVKHCNIFARVMPIHKMRIVKALKDNGEVTAMTGDGVNDSSALKIADIGVAMGKQGSEVSKEAADLVLLDDNLQTILDSVRDGRRIRSNIKKAIGYILAIHLPIALISLVAPLMGIPKDDLMLMPLHIILLELIMDPVCSVALERQPAEEDTMLQPPGRVDDKLMSHGLLLKSLLQGLVIFLGSFASYLITYRLGWSAGEARSFGYSVLILSNIFLVVVNCSEKESFLRSISKLRKEKGIWLLGLFILLGLGTMLYSPVSYYLAFRPLPLSILIFVVIISAASTLWYEAVKAVKAHDQKQRRVSE